MTRPSHRLPAELFEAILALQDAARADAVMPKEGLEYVEAVIHTGVLRDLLAQRILDLLAVER